MQLFLGGFKSWVRESLIVEWQVDCSLLSPFPWIDTDSEPEFPQHSWNLNTRSWTRLGKLRPQDTLSRGFLCQRPCLLGLMSSCQWREGGREPEVICWCLTGHRVTFQKLPPTATAVLGEQDTLDSLKAPAVTPQGVAVENRHTSRGLLPLCWT